MRGLEKGKNKGNKETRETTETKGMRVREIELGYIVFFIVLNYLLY